jgi:hypothetical protein
MTHVVKVVINDKFNILILSGTKAEYFSLFSRTTEFTWFTGSKVDEHSSDYIDLKLANTKENLSF